MSTAQRHDVVVIGAGQAGQAGLAAGYFLRHVRLNRVSVEAGQSAEPWPR